MNIGSSLAEVNLSRARSVKDVLYSKKNLQHQVSTDHVASVVPPVIQYFAVEPKFIKVLVKAHEAELNSIEVRYHVKISREAKDGKISVAPEDTCSTEEHDKAFELFIDLYQQMAQIMKMERFSLKNEKTLVPARKKIHEMSKMFPVFVELARDQKHWELYGEDHDLKAALEFLRKE